MQEQPLTDLHVEYDDNYRILYHPEIHLKQGTPWSEEDLEYLCKYHEYDGLQSMSMALERTQTTIATKLVKLQQTGRYQRYKEKEKYWVNK
ncbi:DNA-entry nuclease [Priestia flexa]|uniref:DNA-entry nuclease n=1 Tax=Priestia flexa TaxID=86664 RepID=UPI003D06955D